jgi:hypothetical protein
MVPSDPDPGGTHYHRGNYPRDSALPDNMVPGHADTNYHVLGSMAPEKGSDTGLAGTSDILWVVLWVVLSADVSDDT